MRVLVCGGRDFNDGDFVWNTLCDLHAKRRIECVIHGAATGADEQGMIWAQAMGLKHVPMVARWEDLQAPGAVVKYTRGGKFYNAKAGPDRNQRMLIDGKPDLVVAFPGGSGTADMVKQARAAGITIIYPDYVRKSNG